MSRISLVAMAIGLVLALMAAAGCTGDDDGGDRNDDGTDEGLGPREPADGQFSLLQLGGAERRYTRAFGSILEPRPRYLRVQMEEGACRLSTWDVAWCEGCERPEGLCNDEGECVENVPRTLSAGPINVSINGSQTLEMYFIEGLGYEGGYQLPEGLFGEGDRLTLSAAGGPEVPRFSLSARMVDPVAIEFEPPPGENDGSAVVLRDGQDLIVDWSPAVRGSRVRLELPTNNRGHGSPPDALIECEANDSGRIVVPRSIVEAFPEKEHYGPHPCPGSTDCPPGRVTRFLADRVDIDGMTIELLVGAQRTFSVVHPR
jgi:hypothetical protein